ncbi:MAG: TIGR04348 family glycosyltransferase [Burkholderiales bacterium]|nr:TIGR04348 family glycosyltransferase [Burkholderiales bacterium]
MSHIFIVTPAGRDARNGNRNTAVRWAALLRSLRHEVHVDTRWDGTRADVLIALHARRSHDSILRFKTVAPGRPLVLALTGTDLYRDIRVDESARRSMALADRMIVLQDMGPAELTASLRAKTRVIYQSARPLARKPSTQRWFDIVVVGHLRDEKDPFRCALAAFHLPAASRIRILHLGRALEAQYEHEARHLMQTQARYRWLGERPHARVRALLARARALVVSSRMEGGANIVSEALAAELPVLASDIGGNIGMLGSDYAGYYPLGDERALARVLGRFEADADYRMLLEAQCRARKPLVACERERAALAALLRELASGEQAADDGHDQGREAEQ